MGFPQGLTLYTGGARLRPPKKGRREAPFQGTAETSGDQQPDGGHGAGGFGTLHSVPPRIAVE